MRDNSLTDQQRQFVVAFTSDPGAIGNASEAARRAGYSEKSARELGRQLLDKPHVLEAIHDANRRQISGVMATKATALLERVVDDEAQPMKLRVDAAKTILDRAGYVPPKAAEHETPGDRKPVAEMTEAELEAFIRRGEEAMQQQTAMAEDGPEASAATAAG